MSKAPCTPGRDREIIETEAPGGVAPMEPRIFARPATPPRHSVEGQQNSGSQVEDEVYLGWNYPWPLPSQGEPDPPSYV